MTWMLLFIVFLTALRLFERAMNKTIRPFEPLDSLWRPYYGRKPDEPPGKTVYDPVAAAQLRKIEERRRRTVPDTGQRRRKTDR